MFGIRQDIDFVAASFTRTAEDVMQIRKLLDENGGKDINIIAKIENAEGVDKIDEIIRVSDGIMIARGDMGVEVPDEEVPVIQKMIIRKVYEMCIRDRLDEEEFGEDDEEDDDDGRWDEFIDKKLD